MTYDWEKYEAEIRHYYREEHWTSEEVRNYINHRYGVNIQSRTLRHKLKEWGIRRVDTKHVRNISWRGVPSPAPVAYSQTGFAGSAMAVCPEHGSMDPAPVAYSQPGFSGAATVVCPEHGAVSPAPVVYSQTGFASSAPVVSPETGSAGPAPVIHSQTDFGSSAPAVYPENGSAGPAPVLYSQTGFAGSSPVVYPDTGLVGPTPVLYSQTGFASLAPVIYPKNRSVGPARMANHAEDGFTQLQPGTSMRYMPIQSLQAGPDYVLLTPQPKQGTHPQPFTSLFPSTQTPVGVQQEARPENPNWGLYQDDGKLAVNLDNYTALSDGQASQSRELTVNMEEIHASSRQPLADLTTSHSSASNPYPSAYTFPSSTVSKFIQGSTDPDVFQNGDGPTQWDAVQLWGRFPDSWSC